MSFYAHNGSETFYEFAACEIEMKILPLLVVILLAFACNLSYRLNIESGVADAEAIRDGEAKYYAERRKYASLQDLIETGFAARELEDGKDSGFNIEINANEEHYSLSIYPDYSQGVVNRDDLGQLSIYCDETGVIRGSTDPNKRADAHSSEMHPKH